MFRDIFQKFVEYFNLDWGVMWGLISQGIFFLRFFIQWLQSEKEKKIIIPLSFWWLSILGAALLFIYAMLKRDIVFILTSIMQLIIYTRNFIIALKSRNSHSFEETI